MKIYEYQGKKILKKFGIRIPDSVLINLNDNIENKIKKINGPYVVKAQIYAGGRGKSGGIKITNSLFEAKKYVSDFLGTYLVTNQTDKNGQKISSVLVERKQDFISEYYIGFVIDRVKQEIIVIASEFGGIDIEKTIKKNKNILHKFSINKVVGLKFIDIYNLIMEINIPTYCRKNFYELLNKLYLIFCRIDVVLLEINPLSLTKSGDLIALDAKFEFDYNSFFRYSKFLNNLNIDFEIKEDSNDLGYIALNGDIGCLVNGAGLAMATMDIIKLFGGEPANFLDIGGGSSIDKVIKAFKIMLRNKKINVIFVNIFGGIMKCDIISNGIILACNEVYLKIPLVVRMKGTNEEIGKKIIFDSKLNILCIDDLEEAVKIVVDISFKNKLYNK